MTAPLVGSAAKPEFVRGSGRRVATTVVRWTLPFALLVAALVAVLGLGGTMLTSAPVSPAPPAVSLDLNRPPPADHTACCR